MKIIGVTGPTGAGKSTITKKLASEGFFIADGDGIARECTEKGSPLLPELAKVFGEDVIKDGELDRRKLASRAFSDDESVHRLNALMHPEIERRMFAKIESHPECEAAVIDAAALIESGIYKRCDFLIVVLAEPSERIRRVMARDGITEEQAKMRIAIQKDDNFYISHADYVLYTDTPTSQETFTELLERIRA